MVKYLLWLAGFFFIIGSLLPSALVIKPGAGLIRPECRPELSEFKCSKLITHGDLKVCVEKQTAAIRLFNKCHKQTARYLSKIHDH